MGFSGCNSFTSSMVRIPVHTTTKSGAEKPIGYVTNYFQDRRSSAQLLSVTENAPKTLFLKDKPYPVWFSRRRKSVLKCHLRRLFVISKLYARQSHPQRAFPFKYMGGVGKGPGVSRSHDFPPLRPFKRKVPRERL